MEHDFGSKLDFKCETRKARNYFPISSTLSKEQAVAIPMTFPVAVDSNPNRLAVFAQGKDYASQ